MDNRVARPQIASWLAAAALGVTLPAHAVTAGAEDGAYVVLAGGTALVDHDCGFYYDCEQTSVGTLRGGLGWRSGGWSAEVWLLRFGNASVGDAYVERTLKLSAVGAVFAWRAAPSEDSAWQWRVGLLRMRHERTGDGVQQSLAPLLGLTWVHPWQPRARLELSWDLTRADGNKVSSTLLQMLTAGVRVRF